MVGKLGIRHRYRHLILIADRSGSMSACRDATEEGINGFFAAQALEPGRATASLYEFDDEHNTVFAHLPLSQVLPYRLVPRRSTALLDAVGFAFAQEGEWLGSLPEAQRPGAVVAVIATDGIENASHEYTLDQIRALITRQRERYSWEVLFIGANMDAVGVAQSYGIPAAAAMTYDTQHTRATFESVSASVSRGRSGAGYAFTDDERRAASGHTDTP
jgi:hypothetical protein